jgi:preprotein translocase subunit SecA
MISILKKLVGKDSGKRLKKYYQLVEKINALEPTFEALSDDELRAKTQMFKEQLASGKSVYDIQVEAFATVREASKRVSGMRPFDVQLIGGLVLAEGNIAEMPTGEGKTLVASLPSYLRALEGKGVHVITVNEYLANRDRQQIGPIHEFLGLTVGLNLPMMDAVEKQKAYQSDITYGVGTEFGFDHLRDNMVYALDQRVQRPYHYAIIDEVDSVLIDEAKTPLIIAGKTGVSSELSYLCARVVKTFVLDEDFLHDAESNTTNLTEEGIEKIEQGFGIENLYELEHQTLYHYVIQALRARVMFKRDVDYIIKDGKVALIDMFTGRPMEGRTLSNGLHQAIEAKEGLEVTEENKTQASVTIQNYFRLYPLLSGMTGTAKTEEKEFQELYGMDVIQIPTNRPVLREDLSDLIFMTIDQKYRAVAVEAKRVSATGQPMLIGTTSILQSEKVAQYLKKEGLSFELLNAKSIEQEIDLITRAGQKGHITIATNMAGRGTDIRLGEGVAELGGLYVIGTERHESRRIDNQLKGRSGRQGDPGRSRFFISLEDEMFKRFASEELEKLIPVVGGTADPETGLVEHKKAKEFVERTQRICEGASYSQREYNLKLDNIINQQRKIIYELRNRVLVENDMLPILEPMIVSYVDRLFDEYCNVEDTIVENWDLKSLEKELVHVLADRDVTFPTIMTSKEELREFIEPVLQDYLAALRGHNEDENYQLSYQRMLIVYMDHHWLEHIEAMERLKEGMGLRNYGGEDPMRQYEREGLELFTIMYERIERDIAKETSRIELTL